MITIRVPATSANLGPGFDSLGVAVNLYLNLTIVKATDKWQIDHDFPYLPHDERNLIIKIAKKVTRDLQPHHLIMETDVPTTRGLGSSSTAIIAGIELANVLGKLNLSLTRKLQLATQFEGHPDNVAPALFGNMVASSYLDNRVYWSKINITQFCCVACIPNKPLSTKESRQVLPETLPLKKAAQGNANSSVLVAQLAQGYMKNVRSMVESDVFHEPYRSHLVPELDKIRQLLKKDFTYGTYLSGAGPTVVTWVPHEYAQEITDKVAKAFPQHQVLRLDIDTNGAQVIEHD